MGVDRIDQSLGLRPDQVGLAGAAHDAQQVRGQFADGALDAGHCALARQQQLIFFFKVFEIVHGRSNA
jgi:hypothetical protein